MKSMTSSLSQLSSRDALRTILDSVQAGVMVMDAATGMVVDVNPAALAILRLSNVDVIGKPCTDFFRAEENENFITYKGMEGEERVHIHKTSMRIVIEDVTYQVETFFSREDSIQLQHEEDEQRMLAEALRDTAKVLNRSLLLSEVLEGIMDYMGRVVQYDAANIMLVEGENARMTAIRGYDRLSADVSKSILGQVRRIADVPNMVRMAESGQPILIPDTRTSPDWVNFTTSFWIRSYVSAPIQHKGMTIGFLNLNSSTPGFYTAEYAERLCAFADQAAVAIVNARLYENVQAARNHLEARVIARTAELKATNEQLQMELVRRQQAEQDLEEERALLALRVEERTAELSAANAELAKAARMKDAFLASMSHELRTPLNAILNISETLQEQVYGELNEDQMRSARMIDDSGKHLLSLINDILDLSKIGAGKLEIMPDNVPVQMLVEASVQFVGEAARKKGITLFTQYDPQVHTVWADQRRLKQILVNLLSNAVKFTPKGGRVGVEVVGDDEHRMARFIVSDTGIGIPQESMKQLFKPFVQLDNSLSRHYEGTGLGLALVYNLVELHGGGIEVTSEEGKGSRFIITLQWEENHTEETLRMLEGEPDLPQDEPPEGVGADTPVQRISRYLASMMIEPTAFWFERGAVERALEGGYDLFVMEASLLTQGRDLLNRIQSHPKTLNLPVLLLSRQQHDLPSLPGTAVLSFPFTRQEVHSLIRTIAPGGTASLVHKAVIFVERKSAALDHAPRVLLADDSEVALKVIGDYLRACGYRLVAAHNGMEAIERARDSAPDLILMDVQMPGLDGLEAIRRIRLDPRTHGIPVITLTALAMPGDRARCLEAGANDYLSKPLSLKALKAAIERFL